MNRTRVITAAAVLLGISCTLPGPVSLAQSSEKGATVILKCQYLAGNEFRTTVAGVESVGPVERLFLARLAPGISCSEAFNLLAEARFEVIHTASSCSADASGDGVVDAADYVVWRKN